jgi:Tol biopolymer transport system component
MRAANVSRGNNEDPNGSAARMSRRAVAVASLLAVASGCASEATRGPAVKPSPATKAELAVTRSGHDIVLLTTDGKIVRELVSRAALAAAGGGSTWSPDGRRLAFVGSSGHPSSEGDETTDIFVVDAARSPSRRLTESGRAFAPVWSPDGRTIVFAEVEPGPRFPATATTWSIGADGSDKRRLLDAERERMDIPTSFSPDGAELAFTRIAGFEVDEEARIANTASIYVLDLNTLEARKLADRASDAAFSPDGRRIAYVSDRDENGELSYGDFVRYANELYVMDLETGEATRLTETRDLNERAPSWSPDGGLIAYTRGEVVGNAEGTVVMTARPDGSCPRRIAFDPGLGAWYTSPVWRPARLRGDAHLRCRPEPSPQAVPLGGALAEARRFGQFELYWLGRRFGELVLSSISQTESSAPRGRGLRFDLHYGDVDLQLSHACVRVPADIDLPPERRRRVRGVDAFFWEGGTHVELVTGTTTVILFGEPRRLLDAIQALRPIDVTKPPAPDEELPPPAPGALAGRLSC